MATPTLLVVEDNPADVYLLKEALAEAHIEVALHVVENGEDAMAFLGRTGQFQDAPRPDAVVLDLNLPLKNGEEVLTEMRADPSLCQIPVAILTTSSLDTHLPEMYAPGRCLYLVKASAFAELIRHALRIHALAVGEPQPQ